MSEGTSMDDLKPADKALIERVAKIIDPRAFEMWGISQNTYTVEAVVRAKAKARNAIAATIAWNTRTQA